MTTLASRYLSLAAADAWPAFSWFDGGGQGDSWLGLEADITLTGDDPAVLDEVGARWRAEPGHVWMGWLTYDVGAGWLVGRPPVPGRMPEICFRRYPAALRSRADDQMASLEAHGDDGACRDLIGRLNATLPFEGPTAWPLRELEAQWPAKAYRDAVGRARVHIEAGDTYQVNLSQVFRAGWATSQLGGARETAQLYAGLRTRCPARMGALVRSGESFIVSNSPETLLDVRLGRTSGDVAASWPIKGTRPRGGGAEADQGLAKALLASAKDRAEHMMIVDLVRNDLGRVARPGTVTVPTLRALMSLPTVHHMVSQVRCTLRPGWTVSELVRAVFPGGSVTGAPKRRTVEIIAELERERREIYCGALVLLEPRGLVMSIPIRTGVIDRGGLWLRSGGGIVFDSDPEQERLETVAKARAFDPRWHGDDWPTVAANSAG